MIVNHLFRSVRYALLTVVAIGAAVSLSWAQPCCSARKSGRAIQQQQFSTAEAAVKALITAAEEDDTAALLRILGPASRDLVCSGDRVADRMGRRKFVRIAHERCDLVATGKGKCMLTLGALKWTFPIPIVRAAKAHDQPAGWTFATEAGRQELLNRRIGRNELTVIQICHAYVDAQNHFAATIGNGKEHARHFRANDGAMDGLYWPARAGQPRSPLGPLLAAAAVDDNSHDTCRPFYGYYFRILNEQGAAAPGGPASEVGDAHMSGAFALIAWPARHGVSGVMTFIVNQSGIVYEKDLGSHTSATASATTRFDPDATWKPVREQDK